MPSCLIVSLISKGYINTHLFLSLVFSQNKQFGKNLAADELLSNSHPCSLCPQREWSWVQGLGDKAIGP